MKKILSSIIVLLVILEYTSLVLPRKEPEKPLIVKSPINKKKEVIAKICNDDYIATELANSKYAYTLTAIAKVESEFKPLIKGDSGKSFGMFQIQTQHWGHVPEEVKGQISKAESILESRIKVFGYNKGIQRYNGTGKKSRMYAAKVLRIVRELQRLERTV